MITIEKEKIKNTPIDFDKSYVKQLFFLNNSLDKEIYFRLKSSSNQNNLVNAVSLSTGMLSCFYDNTKINILDTNIRFSAVPPFYLYKIYTKIKKHTSFDNIKIGEIFAFVNIFESNIKHYDFCDSYIKISSEHFLSFRSAKINRINRKLNKTSSVSFEDIYTLKLTFKIKTF